MQSSAKRERGTLRTSDGLRLYYQFDRLRKPLGAALIIHGFAEHCGRYDNLAAQLNEEGLSCYRFDLRGHGRSEGIRGHVSHFMDYLRDLATIRKQVFAEVEGPRFLLGHSNGGLIAFHHLARDPTGFSGMVLSAPFFALKMKVPAWKRILGRGLSQLRPSFSLPADIHPEWVSHDPLVVKGYAEDPLMGQVATARWFTQTLAAQAELSKRAQKIQLPCLFQLAGDDKVASVEAAEEIFKRLPSSEKRCINYPGFFHEIWFEAQRERSIGDLRRWLSQQLSSERSPI